MNWLGEKNKRILILKQKHLYDAMKDCLNRNYKIAQKFDYKEFNKNVDKNLKKAIVSEINNISERMEILKKIFN